MIIVWIIDGLMRKLDLQILDSICSVCLLCLIAYQLCVLSNAKAMLVLAEQ